MKTNNSCKSGSLKAKRIGKAIKKPELKKFRDNCILRTGRSPCIKKI